MARSETTETKWRLKGFDPVRGEYYRVPGKHADMQTAHEAARKWLADRQAGQQQTEAGPHKIYIVQPDGRQQQFAG